jgi:ribosomal protein L40E
MNLSKFNKELSKRISLAKRYENKGNIKQAIELWLEISDLTLKVSKARGLEPSYRNMLIQKTEQIIEHVKELKSPSPRQKTVNIEAENKSIKHEPLSDDEMIKELPDVKNLKKIEAIGKEERKEKRGEERENKDFSNPKKMNSVDNNSEIENISQGFQEIEAPEDFKIITPHDPEYVEKQMNKEVDMNIFKNKSKSKANIDQDDRSKIQKSSNDKITLDEEDKKGNVICFACGNENPPGSKICKECGTKL